MSVHYHGPAAVDICSQVHDEPMTEFDGFDVDRMDCRDAARVVLATLAPGEGA